MSDQPAAAGCAAKDRDTQTIKATHSADYLGMAARLTHYEVMVADGSHQMLFSAPRAWTDALLTLTANLRSR